MNTNNKQGFTLVEIMIVVAIIALLATIAIPGIIRSRVTANESNAIATLKSIATGAESFRAGQTAASYPTTFAAITTGATPPYVSGFTGGATKAGYAYALVGDADSYNAVANSNGANSGSRNFCIDETGDLRANPLATVYTAVATAVCGGTVVTQ